MTMHYSNPKRANESGALPDVETFFVGPDDVCALCDQEGSHSPDHVGWYWWTCFPGCMPDGDPNGPFATEAEALEDAREGMTDDEPCGECQHEECDGDCEEGCAPCEADRERDRRETAEDEPGEEDYFLSDDERSILYLGKVIVGPVNANAEPSPRDAVMRALAAYMKREESSGAGYWPDVWMISDHGNATLISVLDCGCYFTEHDGRPELHDDANRCRSCGHEYATNEHCGECRDGMKG